MPELPEVETVRRGLEPATRGRTIRSVELTREGLRVPFPANLSQKIEGCRITRLTRRAKYILLHLSHARTGDIESLLILHLGMSGQVTVHSDMARRVARRHDHMIVTLENGAGFVLNDARRFGMVLHLHDGEMDGHPSFSSLGPEPLSEEFTGPVLKARLGRSMTPVKVALLDQRVVAGVGNIYASEALHRAGISPFRAAGTLTGRETSRLVQAIKDVLALAIEAGGSSLRDYRKADGELGYFQHSFSVYGREGEPCPRCPAGARKKHVIHKIMQAGRATYYCPRCQT